MGRPDGFKITKTVTRSRIYPIQNAGFDRKIVRITETHTGFKPL